MLGLLANNQSGGTNGSSTHQWMWFWEVFQQDLRQNHRTRTESHQISVFIRDFLGVGSRISVSMPGGWVSMNPCACYGFNHRTVKHSICFCRNFTWFFGNFDFLDKQHCTFDGDHGVQVPNPFYSLYLLYKCASAAEYIWKVVPTHSALFSMWKILNAWTEECDLQTWEKLASLTHNQSKRENKTVVISLYLPVKLANAKNVYCMVMVWWSTLDWM